MFSPFLFKQILNGRTTQLGFAVTDLAYLRWNYRIKANLDETRENAIQKGFVADWLYGTSKSGNEYPLNQLKIRGHLLSSKIKIHVSPNATQLYYYIKGTVRIDDLEIILSEKEDAEKILNEVIIFVNAETERFGLKTAKAVESLAMLKMEKRLRELVDQSLDVYDDMVLKQGMAAFLTGVRGNVPLALIQLQGLMKELTLAGNRLIEEAKKWGNPDAEKLELDFNETLTAPIESLLRKQKKTDLNPDLGDFKE